MKIENPSTNVLQKFPFQCAGPSVVASSITRAWCQTWGIAVTLAAAAASAA